MEKRYVAETLLEKYKQGICTEEERAVIESWHFKELAEKQQRPLDHDLEAVGERIWKSLPVHGKSSPKIARGRGARPIWFSAAALILCFIAAGFYFFRSSNKPQSVTSGYTSKNQQPDVKAGSNKAVLTLADGSQITLDDATNGEIAEQQGVSITKTAGGQLVYEINNQGLAGNGLEKAMNTITTPKGGQYQVKLPDGSRVWLNAASSLRYPPVFAANERTVELSGEAYFEINPMRNGSGRIPFKVICVADGGQEVEVLGTRFNINAYENESAAKTTLLEGSVRVSGLKSQASSLLQPGQQAAVQAGKIQVSRVDTEMVLAWKKGNFLFNDTDLVEIMKQLERWYDVEVDYSNIPNTHYNGLISREVSLLKVLNMLELTGGFKFKIENLSSGGSGKKIKIIQ